MAQVVYADVLWLIDFSMDLLSLGIASRMVQRPAKGWRLCAAAALGGVWAVLALIGGAEGAVGLLLDFAVAGGMVLLAFGRSSLFRFGLTLGSFFLASLLLGGSMTALCNLFANLLGQPEGSAPSGGGFFLLALAGSGITLLGTHLRRRAAPRHVPVTLTVGERRVTLDALTDSGNLVRDPVSGRGVIFVAEKRLGALVEEPLRAVLLAQRVEGMTGLPPDAVRRLCLIPAETVKGRGVLIALRPDAVEVDGEVRSALICPAPIDGRAQEAVVPAELADGGARILLHK